MAENAKYVTLTEENFKSEVLESGKRCWWISGLAGVALAT